MEVSQVFMYKCTFVILVLFAFHEILSVHGIRQLKSLQNSQEHTNKVEAAKEGSLNAFRPTTPGSSPGVGHHSFGKQHFITGTKDSYGDSAEVVFHKDAFRPTTPGSSPGVGHRSFDKQNNPSATHYTTGTKEDFRRTSPGHSPGVGHSIGKNEEPKA
ncbi:hypothetical protein UlMin_039276 [Ulmus minor]